MAYDDILYTTGGIFFTAACLAWAPGAGLYNPAVVLIVYTIVKMIIGVGSDMVSCFGIERQMNCHHTCYVSSVSSKTCSSHTNSQEDPFGYDESDLPLEKFCKEVDRQITAVAERAKIITFDLAHGPASHMPANRRSSYSIFSATASPSFIISKRFCNRSK